MGRSGKDQNMFEGTFQGGIDRTIQGDTLLFEITLGTYQCEGKDSIPGEDRSCFIKKLLGIKAVELGIFRVWKVYNYGVIFHPRLLHKEATVSNMDVHKRTGKAPVN